MIDNCDPLRILMTTTDPEAVAWALDELRAAGFANPEDIARDFGWEVN